MKNLAAALLSSTVVATTGFAHPGHSISETTSSQSATHYLIEPVHAIPLLAVVVLVVMIGLGARRMRTNELESR